jgi:hypothetical protein
VVLDVAEVMPWKRIEAVAIDGLDSKRIRAVSLLRQKRA